MIKKKSLRRNSVFLASMQLSVPLASAAASQPLLPSVHNAGHVAGGHHLSLFQISHPVVHSLGSVVSPQSASGNAILAAAHSQNVAQTFWTFQSNQQFQHSARPLHGASLLNSVAVHSQTGVGGDLDLSSTTTQAAQSWTGSGFSSATLVVGDKHVSISQTTQITAAEAVALAQVLGSGRQTLRLDASGRAVGGSMSLSSGAFDKVTGLVIPKGVTVTDTVSAGSQTLDFSAGIKNSGTFDFISAGKTPLSLTIDASSILNSAGGLVKLDAGSLRASVASSLAINVTDSLINAGTIDSKGSLSISAGGGVNNSGLLLAEGGNLNLQASLVNNPGTIQATKGAVNFAPYGTGASAAVLTVNGGTIAGQSVNFNNCTGNVLVNVDQIIGPVYVAAANVSINAQKGTLDIGKSNITEDPAYTLTSGTLIIDSNQLNTNGDFFTALSGGDVSFTGNGTVDATGILGGGNITIGAGVTFDGSNNITGASASGGSIKAGSLNLLTNGGDVVLVANSGSATGSGAITIGNIDTHGDQHHLDGGNVTVTAANTTVLGNISTFGADSPDQPANSPTDMSKDAGGGGAVDVNVSQGSLTVGTILTYGGAGSFGIVGQSGEGGDGGVGGDGYTFPGHHLYGAGGGYGGNGNISGTILTFPPGSSGLGGTPDENNLPSSTDGKPGKVAPFPANKGGDGGNAGQSKNTDGTLTLAGFTGGKGGDGGAGEDGGEGHKGGDGGSVSLTATNGSITINGSIRTYGGAGGIGGQAGNGGNGGNGGGGGRGSVGSTEGGADPGINNTPTSGKNGVDGGAGGDGGEGGAGGDGGTGGNGGEGGEGGEIKLTAGSGANDNITFLAGGSIDAHGGQGGAGRFGGNGAAGGAGGSPPQLGDPAGGLGGQGQVSGSQWNQTGTTLGGVPIGTFNTFSGGHGGNGGDGGAGGKGGDGGGGGEGGEGGGGGNAGVVEISAGGKISGEITKTSTGALYINVLGGNGGLGGRGGFAGTAGTGGDGGIGGDEGKGAPAGFTPDPSAPNPFQTGTGQVIPPAGPDGAPGNGGKGGDGGDSGETGGGGKGGNAGFNGSLIVTSGHINIARVDGTGYSVFPFGPSVPSASPGQGGSAPATVGFGGTAGRGGPGTHGSKAGDAGKAGNDGVAGNFGSAGNLSVPGVVILPDNIFTSVGGGGGGAEGGGINPGNQSHAGGGKGGNGPYNSAWLSAGGISTSAVMAFATTTPSLAFAARVPVLTPSRAYALSTGGGSSLASEPGSLDLGGAGIVINAGAVNGFAPLSINVGGKSESITAATNLTSAELVAVLQVMDGSRQTINVNKNGTASHGYMVLDAMTMSQLASSLNGGLASLAIPQRVTVFDSVPNLNLTGSLTNHGSLLTVSSVTGAVDLISANVIVNAAGGTIGAGHVALPAHLLQADVALAGTGSITNAGTMAGTHNVVLNSPSISNSGVVISQHGDIVLTSPGSMIVNAVGGVFQAKEGTVDFRNQSYNSAGNINLIGGTFASAAVNFYSGTGTVDASAEKIAGVVNASAYCAHIGTTASSLILGQINVTGDPNFSSPQDIVIDGSIVATDGNDLAIVAGRNILANGGALVTSSVTGNGGNLTLIAGADFTGSAPNPITIDPGAGSATGGYIDLGKLFNASGTPLTAIDTSSKTGAAGYIQMIAYAGTQKDSGSIALNGVKSAVNALGSTANGDVMLIGGGTSGIYAGQINGGNLTIAGATPVLSSQITFTAGTNSGGFNAYSPGALQKNFITVAGANVANISMSSLSQINGGFLSVAGSAGGQGQNGGNGGNVTISGSGIFITGIDASGGGGGGGGGIGGQNGGNGGAGGTVVLTATGDNIQTLDAVNVSGGGGGGGVGGGIAGTAGTGGSGGAAGNVTIKTAFAFVAGGPVLAYNGGKGGDGGGDASNAGGGGGGGGGFGGGGGGGAAGATATDVAGGGAGGGGTGGGGGGAGTAISGGAVGGAGGNLNIPGTGGLGDFAGASSKGTLGGNGGSIGTLNPALGGGAGTGGKGGESSLGLAQSGKDGASADASIGAGFISLQVGATTGSSTAPVEVEAPNLHLYVTGSKTSIFAFSNNAGSSTNLLQSAANLAGAINMYAYGTVNIEGPVKAGTVNVTAADINLDAPVTGNLANLTIIGPGAITSISPLGVLSTTAVVLNVPQGNINVQTAVNNLSITGFSSSATITQASSPAGSLTLGAVTIGSSGALTVNAAQQINVVGPLTAFNGKVTINETASSTAGISVTGALNFGSAFSGNLVLSVAGTGIITGGKKPITVNNLTLTTGGGAGTSKAYLATKVNNLTINGTPTSAIYVSDANTSNLAITGGGVKSSLGGIANIKSAASAMDVQNLAFDSITILNSSKTGTLNMTGNAASYAGTGPMSLTSQTVNITSTDSATIGNFTHLLLTSAANLSVNNPGTTIISQNGALNLHDSTVGTLILNGNNNVTVSGNVSASGELNLAASSKSTLSVTGFASAADGLYSGATVTVSGTVIDSMSTALSNQGALSVLSSSFGSISPGPSLTLNASKSITVGDKTGKNNPLGDFFNNQLHFLSVFTIGAFTAPFTSSTVSVKADPSGNGGTITLDALNIVNTGTPFSSAVALSAPGGSGNGGFVSVFLTGTSPVNIANTKGGYTVVTAGSTSGGTVQFGSNGTLSVDTSQIQATPSGSGAGANFNFTGGKGLSFIGQIDASGTTYGTINLTSGAKNFNFASSGTQTNGYVGDLKASRIEITDMAGVVVGSGVTLDAVGTPGDLLINTTSLTNSGTFKFDGALNVTNLTGSVLFKSTGGTYLPDTPGKQTDVFFTAGKGNLIVNGFFQKSGDAPAGLSVPNLFVSATGGKLSLSSTASGAPDLQGLAVAPLSSGVGGNLSIVAGSIAFSKDQSWVLSAPGSASTGGNVFIKTASALTLDSSLKTGTISTIDISGAIASGPGSVVFSSGGAANFDASRVNLGPFHAQNPSFDLSGKSLTVSNFTGLLAYGISNLSLTSGGGAFTLGGAKSNGITDSLAGKILFADNSVNIQNVGGTVVMGAAGAAPNSIFSTEVAINGSKGVGTASSPVPVIATNLSANATGGSVYLSQLSGSATNLVSAVAGATYSLNFADTLLPTGSISAANLILNGTGVLGNVTTNAATISGNTNVAIVITDTNAKGVSLGTLSADQGLNLTAAGPITVVGSLNSAVGAVSLTAGGATGSITAKNTVSAATTLTLTATGNGAIASSKTGVYQAPDLELTNTSSKAAATGFNVMAGAINLHPGVFNIINKKDGNVTVSGPSVTALTLVSKAVSSPGTSTLTLNGINTTNGGINVSSDYATTVISNNLSTQNGSISVLNSNATGKIDILSGVLIHGGGVTGTLGQVTLAIGSIPGGTSLLPGTAPAGPPTLHVEQVGGTVYFANKAFPNQSITVNGTGNVISALDRNVILNSNGTNNIVLEGSNNITADPPPAPAAAPSPLSVPQMEPAQASLSLASPLAPVPSAAPSVSPLPALSTVISAQPILAAAALQPGLAVPHGGTESDSNLNAIYATRGDLWSESGALQGGVQKFSETPTANVYRRIRPAAARCGTAASEQSVPAATLVCTKQDQTYDTEFGAIDIKAGSVVLLVRFAGGLSVYDLHDEREKAVVMRTGDEAIELRPGMHATMSHSKVGGFGDVNPAQFVGYRNVVRRNAGAAASAFAAEFEVLPLIGSVQPLRQLINSKVAGDVKLANKMLKTALILTQLGGKRFELMGPTPVAAMATH